MKFYKLIVISFLLSTLSPVQSQTDSTTVKETKPMGWNQVNKVGLDLSEVSFVNWNAGGSNSISALLRLASRLDYRKENFAWNNILRARYGVNKQEDQNLRKTEDELEVISNLGYRKDTLTNWYYSARMNFKTQFSNGYNYPNTDTPLSRFMAPGYFFLGAGAEYGKNIDKLSLYLSPLTLKTTFVLDQDLADIGSFGVEPAILDAEGNMIRNGKKVRTEMGILLTNMYETEVLKNINLINRFNLYTDYLNSFGNVDVDWEVIFDFKVNKNVSAVLGSHLRYDNDIKIVEVNEDTQEEIEKGAVVQWKQLLGIGVTMDF